MKEETGMKTIVCYGGKPIDIQPVDKKQGNGKKEIANPALDRARKVISRIANSY